MNYKRHYNRRHNSLFFKENDWTLLKLHHEYNISSFIEIINKLTQQFVESFKMLIKIERLAYKLNMSDHWKVHSVFFVTQLESISSLNSNFYKRFISDYSNSIFIEEDIETMRSYELKRFLNKRTIWKEREQSVEYLIKWKNYDSEFDKWMNIKNLNNVKDFIVEYENSVSTNK